MKRTMNHFVNTAMIAAHFGLQQNTIRQWIDLGCPYRRCGRVYRYSLPEVEAWIDRKTQQRLDEV